MIIQRVKMIHNIKYTWIILKLHLSFGKIFVQLNMTGYFIFFWKALHLHRLLWGSALKPSVGIMNRSVHLSSGVDSQPQSPCVSEHLCLAITFASDYPRPSSGSQRLICKTACVLGTRHQLKQFSVSMFA